MADNQIVSLNMTGFFKRELQMYALGDIKFKKPIPLKQVGFILGFFIVWTLPIVLVFGVVLQPLYAAILIVPPVVLGTFAIRPIFEGKTLIDYTVTAVKFLGEPKHWTDMKAWGSNVTYEINSAVWVSRRREHNILADIFDAENPTKPSRKSKAVNRKKKKQRK